MDREKGFVILHRQTLSSSVFDDPITLKVWTWCLLRASFKEREIQLGNQWVRLGRGEFVTGIFSATKELKIGAKMYRNRIALLQKNNRICVKRTNKYHIISVVNWDYFQVHDEDGANKGQTKGKQRATNNNDNNGNTDLGEASSPDDKSSLLDNEKDMWNKYSDDYEEEAKQIDPDYKPVRKKKEKAVSDDVQAVFDLFNNPAKVTWRLREIERVAAQGLFDAYGLETLKKRIERIEKEKKNKDPMFPLAVTPSQLLDKMPNIERYFGI